MSDSQKYSIEELYNLLQQVNKKGDQTLDIVQLLIMGADDNEASQRAILASLEVIKQTTTEINSKMDLVLEKLTKLESDFSDLKKENRDVEQKLMLMMTKLSKLDDAVQGEELEDYYALSQSLYANWEEFDALTRKFIPISEFLFSKLQKYNKPDYSPVILELCRAIENEFLLKIFRKYTFDLITRKGKNLDRFFSKDRSTSALKNKTTVFVKAISKANKSGKAEYTLGQMNTILSIANETDVVSSSPLMQDFVEYLSNNTEAQNLLDSQYISNVNKIVEDYRNPSAHPELMPLEKAEECRMIMPDRLDYLMDCLNF